MNRLLSVWKLFRLPRLCLDVYPRLRRGMQKEFLKNLVSDWQNRREVMLCGSIPMAGLLPCRDMAEKI